MSDHKVYIPFDAVNPTAGNLNKENQKQKKKEKSCIYINMLQE